MAPLITILTFIICSVQLGFAHPFALTSRNAQKINVNVTVSEAKFRSFENPHNLKRYLESRGFNYKVNYTTLASYVAEVNDYFDGRLANHASARGLLNSRDDSTFSVEERDDSPIKTHTHSTTLRGGPSYTNVTLSANATYVDAVSFSDGNAATAGGAIQMGTTVSSTSSSGKSNSTGTVTGTPKIIQILVNSTTTDTKNQQLVNAGQEDALTGASCSAQATGASSSASILTTLVQPVNTAGKQSLRNVAKAFCEAGKSALKASSAGGSSNSGSQSSLTQGVRAGVTCNGVHKAIDPAKITFNLAFKGTYSDATGLVGTFKGNRLAKNSASCS